MNTQKIFDIIVGCTREIIPDLRAHDFQVTDSLAALGANSIDRAEIVMLVLESLRLQIPRTELFGPKNVGELADLLYAKLQRK